MNADSPPGSSPTVVAADLPTAPPGASEVQLELWRRVLSHRCRQMRTLSPLHFQSYASGLLSDLETSRRRGGGGTADLAAGRGSSHLLRRRPTPAPPFAAEDVTRHVLALFYRSVDGRLSDAERRHGLDAVKGAFASLEAALKDQAPGVPNAREREVPPLVFDPNDPPDDREGGGGVPRSKRGRDPPPVDLSNVTDEEGGRESKRGRRGTTAPVVHTNDASENQSKDRLDGTDSRGGGNPSDDADQEEGPESKRGRRETAAPIIHTNAVSEKQSQLQPAGTNNDEGEESNGIGQLREATGGRSRTDLGSQSDPVLNPTTAVETNAAAMSSSNTENKGAGGLSGRPSSRKASSPNQTEASPSGKKRTSHESQPSRSQTALHSTALPPPAAHFCARSIAFLSDIHFQGTASGSLQPRDSCSVSYDGGFNPNGSGSCLADKALIDVRERLERWDPYWRTVQELGRQDVPSAAGGRKTKSATRTTACAPVFHQVAGTNAQNLPASCAAVTVDLPREHLRARLSNTDTSLNESNDDPWGLKWREAVAQYRTGDRRLLLRMLPLNRSDYEKKRCDTHLWPRGTFVQLSRGKEQRVLHLSQRQQQSHDPKLWKGLCRPLDLTPFLPDATAPFCLKICAKEAIEGAEGPRHLPGARVRKMFRGEDGRMRPFAGTVRRYDARFKLYQIAYDDGDAEELTEKEVACILEGEDAAAYCGERALLHGSYAVHLAVCEYIAPEDLFDRLAETLPRITLDESRRMARRHLENNTVSIDSDSEGGGASLDASSGSFLTFSLLCPISKAAMSTPVRGRRCKHMQCFDLRTWLQSNRHVSGGRWRCGVCDDFVAATDLVVCGLFGAMLRDHRDEVSGARDKVSYRPDGTWRLKEENRLRHSGKRRGSGEAGKEERAADGGNAGQKRGASEPEVIDLL